jgi:hypothetical protein
MSVCNNINSDESFVYLRAYRTAQKPIIKEAKTGSNKHTQRQPGQLGE